MMSIVKEFLINQVNHENVTKIKYVKIRFGNKMDVKIKFSKNYIFK